MTISNSEFYENRIMGFLCNQIAQSIYVVVTSGDPLVSRIAVHDGPQIIRIMTADDLKVFAKRLQSMAAPNIVLRIGMTDGFEIFVEGIFVQYVRLR